MLHLDNPAVTKSQRHPPANCAYLRRDRSAVVARANSQTVDATNARATSPSSRAGQAQLVWHPSLQGAVPNGVLSRSGLALTVRSSQAPGDFDYEAKGRAILLMQRIKAARHWQQLQAIVDENARALNYLHVSAIVTHMAQLHSSSSRSTSDDVGPGSSGDLQALLDNGFRSSPSAASSGTPEQHSHVSHALGRVHARSASPGSPAHTIARGVASSGKDTVPTRLQPLARSLSHPSAAHHPSPSHRSVSLSVPRVPDPASGGLSGQHLAHPEQSVASDQQLFLQRMERAVLAHLHNFQGRQLANTLWAVAKLGHRPPGTWLEAVLMRTHAKFGELEPQHLSNTLYALMLLKYLPPPFWMSDFFATVVRRMPSFGPVELAQLCLAGGKLRLRPGKEVLNALIKHADHGNPRYGMRELSMCLYGIMRMGGSVQPGWMRRFRVRVLTLIIKSGALPQRTLEALAPKFDPEGPLARCAAEQLQQQLLAEPGQEGDLEQLLQGLLGHVQQDGQGQVDQGQGRGRLEQEQRPLSRREDPVLQPQRDPEQLREAAAASQAVAGAGSGDGATHAQRQKARPGSLLAPASSEQASSEQADESIRAAAELSRNLPAILLTMAGLQYQPPPLFMAIVLLVIGRSARLLDARQMTDWMIGVAFLRWKPRESFFEHIWTELMLRLDTLNPQQLTNVLWALPRLGCRVPSRDLDHILLLAAGHLPEHSDVQIVALLQAAAGLQPAPGPEWLELLESHLYQRLPQLPAAKLVAVLQSLAALGHRPPRTWMNRWMQVMRPLLPELGLQQLAAVAHAAAELHFRPPASFAESLLAAAAKRMREAAETPGGQPWQHAGLQQQHECRVRLRELGSQAAWAPSALSRLLWGLAMLDVRPDARWMKAYLACLRLAMRHLEARELSQVVWALARLRHDPGPGLMAQFSKCAAAAGAASVASQGAAGAEQEGAGHCAGPKRGGSVPTVEGEGYVASVRPRAGVGIAPDAGDAMLAVSGLATGGDVLVSGSGGQGLDYSQVILQGMIAWAARQVGEPPRSAVDSRHPATVVL